MGYYSSMGGTIRVEPGIPEHLLGPSGALHAYNRDNQDAETDLVVVTHDNSTVGILPSGEIGVIGDSYSEIENRWEEPQKLYEVENGLAELLRLIEKHSPGSVANGALVVHGEENNDIWRMRVENNVVHHERPKLLWPNGDEENL